MANKKKNPYKETPVARAERLEWERQSGTTYTRIIADKKKKRDRDACRRMKRGEIEIYG